MDNPKHIQAMKEGKIPYEFIPMSVLGDSARALRHGAEKYGVRNWRLEAIKASTYEGAILRHFTDWQDGIDIDPDSGLPHLNMLIANALVILDAQKHGTFIDDRDRKETRS